MQRGFRARREGLFSYRSIEKNVRKERTEKKGTI